VVFDDFVRQNVFYRESTQQPNKFVSCCHIISKSIGNTMIFDDQKVTNNGIIQVVTDGIVPLFNVSGIPKSVGRPD
jgi:hypothetical protein